MLNLISRLFPCDARAGDSGKLRVKEYHKSVKDWVTDKTKAGAYFTDELAGSRILATRSAALLVERSGAERCGHAYACQHAIAHACLAGDAALLQRTVLDFKLWQAIYAAGK